MIYCARWQKLWLRQQLLLPQPPAFCLCAPKRVLISKFKLPHSEVYLQCLPSRCDVYASVQQEATSRGEPHQTLLPSLFVLMFKLVMQVIPGSRKPLQPGGWGWKQMYFEGLFTISFFFFISAPAWVRVIHPSSHGADALRYFISADECS